MDASNNTKPSTVNLEGVGQATPTSTVDAMMKGVSPEREKQAQANVDRLMDFSLSDDSRTEMIKNSVENIGLEIEKENARFSPMLQKTIGSLKGKDGGGTTVADALVKLKMEVEELDPVNMGTPGAMGRLLGKLPFVGNPVKKYFAKYESAQVVLQSIMQSLVLGREQLERDNITLAADQRSMRELTKKLESAVDTMVLMKAKMEDKVATLATEDERNFVKGEILYRLNQRITDLQQTLAVNQQGVLAIDVVIQNNKELIRSARRTQETTMNALQVAVVVAVALNNQELVLDKIDGINKTTNTLIANTANRLKTQGVAIQKQASEQSLQLETLKKAFADINGAMTDLSNYRIKSLDKMNESIVAMQQLTTEAESHINKLEKGNKVRSNLIDLEVK